MITRTNGVINYVLVVGVIAAWAEQNQVLRLAQRPDLQDAGVIILDEVPSHQCTFVWLSEDKWLSGY
jgi:hypothetical protein